MLKENRKYATTGIACRGKIKLNLNLQTYDKVKKYRKSRNPSLAKSQITLPEGRTILKKSSKNTKRSKIIRHQLSSLAFEKFSGFIVALELVNKASSYFIN